MDKKLTSIEITFTAKLALDEIKTILANTYPDELLDSCLKQQKDHFVYIEDIPQKERKKRIVPFIGYYFAKTICQNLFGFRSIRLKINDNQSFNDHEKFFQAYPPIIDGYSKYLDLIESAINGNATAAAPKTQTPDLFKFKKPTLICLHFTTASDIKIIKNYLQDYYREEIQLAISKVGSRKCHTLTFTLKDLNGIRNIPYYNFIKMVCLREDPFSFVQLGVKPENKQRYALVKDFTELFPNEPDRDYVDFTDNLKSQLNIKFAKRRTYLKITNINIKFNSNIDLERLQDVFSKHVSNKEPYTLSTTENGFVFNCNALDYKSCSNLSVWPIIYILFHKLSLQSATIKPPRKKELALSINDDGTTDAIDKIWNELLTTQKGEPMNSKDWLSLILSRIDRKPILFCVAVLWLRFEVKVYETGCK